MKPAILIPVVTHKGRRTVPHYTGNADPGAQLVLDSLHDAREPYRHESPKVTHPSARTAGTTGARTTIGARTEWIEAPRWEGRLTVTDYAGGRSSSCYVVEIATAKGPPVVGLMSCLTFLPLIPKLVNGGVIGTFTARKIGQNYLIRELSDPKP